MLIASTGMAIGSIGVATRLPEWTRPTHQDRTVPRSTPALPSIAEVDKHLFDQRECTWTELQADLFFFAFVCVCVNRRVAKGLVVLEPPFMSGASIPNR